MELTSPYHYKLGQDKEWSHYFRILEKIRLAHLPTEKQFEQKYQYELKKTPHHPQSGWFDLILNVHSNEYRNYEVSIHRVPDKQRGKHNVPTHL
jgi:hypothetical protein